MKNKPPPPQGVNEFSQLKGKRMQPDEVKRQILRDAINKATKTVDVTNYRIKEMETALSAAKEHQKYLQEQLDILRTAIR